MFPKSFHFIIALTTDSSLISNNTETSDTGEKQCVRNWKERLHSLRAARAASALRSLSVWQRTEQTRPSLTRKVPTLQRRVTSRLNAVAERGSRYRRTPLTRAPFVNQTESPEIHSLCLPAGFPM